MFRSTTVMVMGHMRGYAKDYTTDPMNLKDLATDQAKYLATDLVIDLVTDMVMDLAT